MPHFEDYYADKLRGAHGLAAAGTVLDLRGVAPEAALDAVDALLDGAAAGPPDTVAIRLDPPPEGGGETLFQPVGRRLLAARREGRVAHLSPLPAADGLGYFVAFAG